MLRMILCALLCAAMWLPAGYAGGATTGKGEAEEAASSPTNQEEKSGTEGVPEMKQTITVTGFIPELATEARVPMEKLEQTGAADLGLGLRKVAGLSAIRRGGVNLDPTIRGLQETQVAMFVNGARAFAAGPARMDSEISHVSPHGIRRVQLVKGPYALTWGGGAMSALKVETFTPEFSGGAWQTNGDVGFHYGDNASMADGFASVWAANDRMRVQVFHNRRTGEDYEDGDGAIVPGDFDSSETSVGLGFRLGSTGRLQYHGAYQNQEDIDYPGRLLDATYFKNRAHSLEYVWNGGGALTEARVQAYANIKDHAMSNDQKPTARPNPDRTPPFALDVMVDTDSDVRGVNAHLILGGDEAEWKVGLDYYRLEQNAARVISRRDVGTVLVNQVIWPDAEVDALGVYANLSVQRGRWRFGSALRLNAVDSDVGQATQFFLDNTEGGLAQSDSEADAAFSARYEAGDRWVWSFSAGSVTRTPTVLERYADRFPSVKFQSPAEFLGNPELGPERSNELDLGVRAAWIGWNLAVDVFYRQIDDVITYAPAPELPRRLPLSPQTVFRYINGDRASYYGGEAMLDGDLGHGLSWRATLAYLWGEDETYDEAAVGVSPLELGNALRYSFAADRGWTELEAVYTDSQDRVAVSRLELPTDSYALFHLRGGYEIGGGWQVIGGVENAGDKAYVDHLNAKNPYTGQRILEPGRNLYLKLSYAF